MVGLISGTSMDAVDVAVVDLALSGDAVRLDTLGTDAVEYPPRLRARLAAALPPGRCDTAELCQLDTEVGQAFAAAARHGLARWGGGAAGLVGSLGQTIYHWVDGGRCRGTLQIGQPAWIAEATGLPVISDLRARDVAAGGHGAPLAALLDSWWLAAVSAGSDQPPSRGTTVALNLGGIANITVASGPDVVAYDTGPANALLDAACLELTRGRHDHDPGGTLAADGRVLDGLLDRLLADPYYAAPPPKSTGKEYFNGDYLRTALASWWGDRPDDGRPGTADLLATLVELTARTVADACARHRADRVVVSGGGVGNRTLMSALARAVAPAEVVTAEALGLPSDGKEACLAALLGFLGWHGLPANLPSATGASGPRLLGSITPGADPLTLPQPHPQRPRRLLLGEVDRQLPTAI
ncbi:anhydro-N-acetylmuramic acid kinase [Actinoalloteichus sp. AHMU CJ021]|nr:anhydro-N-acetylmuramic acid kinase [Actinoalloteichus sp. AHMU CJ021]